MLRRGAGRSHSLRRVSEQATNGLDAPPCRPSLLLKDLPGPVAHGLGFGRVGQQAGERLGQLCASGDVEGLVGQEIFRDGAEIGVVGTHDDGDAELRRLQRIVSAGGNQAPADERHRGNRVDRGQFTDRIEKDDLDR